MNTFLKNTIFFFIIYNFQLSECFNLDSECSINDDVDSCLSNWNCGWCNISNISESSFNDKYLGYLLTSNTSCIPIFPCFSDSNSLNECKIKKHYMCEFIYAFINIVIIFGFCASVFMLSYTIEKLMNRENITNNTKNAIQTIFYFIIALPIIVLFLLNQEIFLYLFTALIFFSILSCLFNVNNNRQFIFIRRNNYSNDIDENNKLLN